MKKTLLFILLTAILVILNTCAAPSTAKVEPPTQTPASTPTSPPPTPTVLPPTPALDGLLLTGETLSTATGGVPRYTLNRTGWKPIPPVDLSDELSALEGWDYAQSEQGALQIVDLDGNPVWTEISGVWIQLPVNLSPGFQIINNGQNIVDANGKPLYLKSTQPGKEGEWIKDYERIYDLENFRDNQLTIEDIEEGHIEEFFEAVLKPEFQEKTNWDIVKDWPYVAGGGSLHLYSDSTKNVVKFPNPETAPFIKNTGFCGELVVGKNRYLHILFAIRDPEEKEIVYVNLDAPLQKDGVPLTPAEIEDMIRIFKEQMNFYLIAFDGKPYGATQADPLFTPVEKGSLMEEIIISIARDPVGSGDLSRLAELTDTLFVTYPVEISEDEWNGLFTNSFK